MGVHHNGSRFLAWRLHGVAIGVTLAFFLTRFERKLWRVNSEFEGCVEVTWFAMDGLLHLT